jgi:hypothetical protein
MTIELYVFPPSPRSFKVMAVANHLGLDWTPRFVDLTKGDQKTPQYGWRLRAVGIKCHWPISGIEATGKWIAAQR